MWIAALFFVVVVGLLLLYYIIEPTTYWKKRHVVHEKPLPLFGHMLPLIIGKKNNADILSQFYKQYQNERYFGLLKFRTPELVICDPDLIKELFVKEFATFCDHKPFIHEEINPIWCKNLAGINGGENWHELRSILSPTFSSSKMKAMFGFMKDCCKQFSKYFMDKEDLVEVELKDVFRKYGNDVIATVAFGVTCESLSNPSNEFYATAKDLSYFDGINGLVFKINFLMPTLANFLKIPVFSRKSRNFLATFVNDAIKYRIEKDIFRPDMLQLLIEAQKKGKVYITNEIITAQVFLFFFAGFDTISTMISYVFYELTMNPEVQNKVQQEIDGVLANSNDFTYKSVMNMKYLEMVILETLRKWPSFTMTDRRCVKPYTIDAKGPNKFPLYLEKHSIIICPIQAIHLDPRYYPNPEKFDPERFNDENKAKITPYTYLPFGLGPRYCLGSRYSLLKSKLIVAEIISKFELVRVEKTPTRIVISKKNISPLPDGGIWIGLKKRSK